MVGYWDADLATPLEAILQFRAVLAERPELVLVMGSRVALLGRQIRRRWKRHLLGRAFATAASLVLGLPVYDTQCGAKLFRVTPRDGRTVRPPVSRAVDLRRGDPGPHDRVGPAGGERPADEMIYEYPLERWQDVAGLAAQVARFPGRGDRPGGDPLAVPRGGALRRVMVRDCSRCDAQPARREAA